MDTPIAVIPKNKAEELRISLKEYKGHPFVDVRTFVEPYADSGQGRVLTRKGVTLGLGRLHELIAALRRAELVAREAGLLGDKSEAA